MATVGVKRLIQSLKLKGDSLIGYSDKTESEGYDQITASLSSRH